MRASCESYAAKDAKTQIAPVTRPAPGLRRGGRQHGACARHRGCKEDVASAVRRLRLGTRGCRPRRRNVGRAGDTKLLRRREAGAARGRVLSAASGSAPGARGDAVGFWQGSEAASAFLVREPQLVLCALCAIPDTDWRCAQHPSGVGRGRQTQTKTYMYISSAACAAAACS